MLTKKYDITKVWKIVRMTDDYQRDFSLCRDDSFYKVLNELDMRSNDEEALIAWERFEELNN